MMGGGAIPRFPGEEMMTFLKNLFAKKPVLERPIDQSIKKVNKELRKWNHPERREIINAALKTIPGEYHLHANPRPKMKNAAA